MAYFARGRYTSMSGPVPCRPSVVRHGLDSDILASVADQFETDTATPGNGLVKNKSFVLRRFAEAVRPKCYRGLAERARRQRATT